MSKKGYKLTEEHKKSISKGRLKRKEKLGYLNSPKTRKKISKSCKGNMPWNKGKTDIYSKETLRKMREKQKGKPLSKEHRKNLSKNHKTKRGFSSAMKGKHHSEETIKKISKSMTGKEFSEKTKRKMRLSTIKYIKETKGPMYPRIGKNEKIILDTMEEIYGYKVIRQYHIKSLGYFVDGYIKELNLVIEVDERDHFDSKGKLEEKDIRRQKEIEKELNCKFLRINDSLLEDKKRWV